MVTDKNAATSCIPTDYVFCSTMELNISYISAEVAYSYRIPRTYVTYPENVCIDNYLAPFPARVSLKNWFKVVLD